MPAAINIEKEQVRMLVLTIGVRPAAAKLGLPVSTVGTWSEEGKWLACTKPQPATMPKPASMVNPNSPNSSPADALADTLSQDGEATRLAASRYARKVVTHAADNLDPDKAMTAARNIKDAVVVASLSQPGWTVADGGMQINLLCQNVENLHIKPD